MSESKDRKNQRPDSARNSRMYIHDVETDLANGHSANKLKESDMTPISLGRSRNDTQTIKDKSDINDGDSPSTPASELSEEGMEMLPTLRSDYYNTNTNGVETEHSPLNFGKLVNKQSNGEKFQLRDQLKGRINNVEQAK